jgi:hypothetical protein
MTVDGIDGLVENGVSCGLLTSGTVTILPASAAADEVFVLTADQAARVVAFLGRKKCVDLGVIPA